MAPGGTAMDILSLTEGRKIQEWRASTDPQKLKIQGMYDRAKDELKADKAACTEWRDTLIRPADRRSNDPGGHNATQKRNVIGMQRALTVSAQAGQPEYNVSAPDLMQAGSMNILNVRAGMKKSPSAPEEYDWRVNSFQPGQYADKLKQSIDSTIRHKKLEQQIKAAATKERNDRLKRTAQTVEAYSKPVSATVEPGTFLAEWLNEYGRPKRVPRKEETFLSYNAGPVGIVKSSSSKTTRKRDELSQTALDLLGNSITGMPRTLQVSQRADEPIVKFETTRSNANIYRKGRLTN
jgi:hypothetical protein